MRTKIFLTFIIGIVFQSCISIKHSSLRAPNVEIIETANCKISSTGAVYMKMFGMIKSDFMPASIKIEYDDLLLYVDPLVVDDTLGADYILITHNHMDHFSKKDIKKISKSGTIVIGPKPVTKKLKRYTVKMVTLGDKLDYGKIKCEVVESYNLNSKIHKKGSKNVGYIITCDATKIYVAGDTDFIPEMTDLKNISVAINPIGIGKTAMNPQSAANAANIIKPKIVIPIHYELGQNSEKEFYDTVDKEIEVRFFQPSLKKENN